MAKEEDSKYVRATSGVSNLLVVPGEGGSAGSCMVLVPCFLAAFLDCATDSPSSDKGCNRLCMNVFWSWFASIFSASLLALEML